MLKKLANKELINRHIDGSLIPITIYRDECDR